jgi:hypothetical protein
LFTAAAAAAIIYVYSLPPPASCMCKNCVEWFELKIVNCTLSQLLYSAMPCHANVLLLLPPPPPLLEDTTAHSANVEICLLSFISTCRRCLLPTRPRRF